MNEYGQGLIEYSIPEPDAAPVVRILITCFMLAALAGCSARFGRSPLVMDDIEASRIELPNGWAITPVGESLPLGDLPLNMAVSPSGELLAVTNNGQSDQIIQLIDADHHKVLDTLLVGKDRPCRHCA